MLGGGRVLSRSRLRGCRVGRTLSSLRLLQTPIRRADQHRDRRAFFRKGASMRNRWNGSFERSMAIGLVATLISIGTARGLRADDSIQLLGVAELPGTA